VTRRRRRLVSAAVIVVVLAGWYVMLDDRGVPEARAWVETHPTFEQVPQDHWQVTADRTWTMGPLDGRLLPQLNSLLAARRTVWNVPGDNFDTVVAHVASVLQYDETPTEALGHHWYEQPRSTFYGFTTRSDPVDDRRRQGASITLTDTHAGVEVIISVSQHERHSRR
jgi:hypothetical protein